MRADGTVGADESMKTSSQLMRKFDCEQLCPPAVLKLMARLCEMKTSLWHASRQHNA